MSLNMLPPAPNGVRYALTVPQSVLFADLSLRGNRRQIFREVFAADFELNCIIIDDGAMSWNFTGDAAFAKTLFGTTDAIMAVRRFIAAMGTTARAVEKTSWLLCPPCSRRLDNVQDLIDDLHEYWDAYERHMTSLFTFWNVEDLLSHALITQLKSAGLDNEIASGLQRFLQPSETNYFALERRRLGRLASRFRLAGDKPDPNMHRVLEQHISDFGFLLAPFNLGVPPSVKSVIERLDETIITSQDQGPLLDMRSDALLDIPDPIRELGFLAQELTFWKTERLDVLSLGDARIADLYRTASAILSLNTEQFFAMRREEIEDSLKQMRVTVDERVLSERLSGYCMAMFEGEITFFMPSRQMPEPTNSSTDAGLPSELRGIGASPGVISASVRIINDLNDIHLLAPGDILVTSMTRPEMGVALDRAAAFVTDEGGRMSHAAIIAREMGKPCVIGTGTATQVLQDGMHVQVDGGTGIITILDDIAQ